MQRRRWGLLAAVILGISGCSAPTSPDEAWVEYRSGPCGAIAALPAPPEEERKTIPADGGAGMEQAIAKWTDRITGATYRVTCTLDIAFAFAQQAPASYLQSDAAAKLADLEKRAENVIELGKRSLTLRGRSGDAPGIYQALGFSHAGKAFRILRKEYIVSGDRALQLNVTLPDPTPEGEARANRFLDSVRLTEDASDSSPH